MPAVEARIYFYDIVQAGYYRHGESAPAFGDVADSCARLFDWRRREDKLLSETATYEPAENSRLTTAYCAGIERDATTGDYLVTMWNRSETFGGGELYASLSDSPLGQLEIFTREVPPGTIPGYPSYFWVFPQLGRYASVQVNPGRNGRNEFDYYMRSFLTKFTEHAIYEGAGAPEYFEEATDRTILGYRDPTADGSPPGAIYPRWKATRIRSDGPIDRIRQARRHIRKIVRKNSLNTRVDVGRDIAQRFFEFLGAIRGRDRIPDGIETLHINLEMEITPSAEELEAIIDDWRYHEEQGSKWNDAGFILEGSGGQPLWLSHSTPKGSLMLDLPPDTSPILINGPALLKALTQQRGTAVATVG